ncbi:hypothetical protein ACTA71_009548 [Dictyostelium dimigraforme]
MRPKCQLITDIIATEANPGQIRNNLKFNNSRGTISTELATYKMEIAQETAWNGTLTRINKLVRRTLTIKEQENQTNLKKKIIANLDSARTGTHLSCKSLYRITS